MTLETGHPSTDARRMTVPNEISRVSYLRGAAVTFAFPFAITKSSQLTVESGDADGTMFLQEGVDYTVAGVRNPSGGTVTIDPGSPLLGIHMYLSRSVPLTQLTEFSTQGAFSPRVHEDAFDLLTMAVQQLSRELSAAKLRITALELLHP